MDGEKKWVGVCQRLSVSPLKPAEGISLDAD